MSTNFKSNIVNAIKRNKTLYKAAWFLKKLPVFPSLKTNIKGYNNKIVAPISVNFVESTFNINGNNNKIEIGEKVLKENITWAGERVV